MGGAVARVTRPFRPTPTPAPAPAPTPSPTAPEVSQATATSMDGYDAILSFSSCETSALGGSGKG